MDVGIRNCLKPGAIVNTESRVLHRDTIQVTGGNQFDLDGSRYITSVGPENWTMGKIPAHWIAEAGHRCFMMLKLGKVKVVSRVFNQVTAPGGADEGRPWTTWI